MNTFSKEERLIQKKLIDKLYSLGKSFINYPLLFTYYELSNSKNSVKILITISKKRIKKAIDRNIIKRRIREAYRIHKNEFYETLLINNIQLILSISLVGNYIPKFDEIETQIVKMIIEFNILFQNKKK